MKDTTIYESPTKFQEIYIHYNILFSQTGKIGIVFFKMETEVEMS